MEGIIKDYIKGLYAKDRIIKSIDQDIQKMQDHKNECLEYLKTCLGNSELKAFIDQKLVEGNEKFELDKNKGKVDEQILKSECKSSSSNGDTKTTISEYKNPRGKFIPNQDTYEILSIEQNNEGKYKITVDNTKGRQYIGVFNWIVDEYYTDWFEV